MANAIDVEFRSLVVKPVCQCFCAAVVLLYHRRKSVFWVAGPWWSCCPSSASISGRVLDGAAITSNDARLSAVFSSCGWSRPVAHCDAACELRLHGASVEAGEDAGVHARLQSPQGVQSLASFPDHSDCATRTNDIKTWYCWVPLTDLQQSVDSKTRDRVLLCSYVNSFATTPLDVRSSTRLNGFNRPGWRWQWRTMRDEVRKQVSGAWAWWRRPEESEWSLVFAHYSTAG